MFSTKNTFINRTKSNSNCFDWILVQKTGTISFRLGNTNATVIGSEGCDINIQSPSVEGRHAVLFFDPKSTHFTVKDLQSSNGTYLNEQRLSPQTPVKLNHLDILRFGYGCLHSNLYEIRSGSSGQINTNNINTCANSGGLMSDRLLRRRMSDSANTPTANAHTMPTSTSGFSRQVIQGVRASSLCGSRVTSPSFTLDSGHGSSSSPSSPAKEMSPLPNSVSSSASSPVPQNFKMQSQNSSNLEFGSGLSHSNLDQLLTSGLKSRQRLSVSEDENEGKKFKNRERIRKDSLEDENEGNGKVLAPEFGKGEPHPLLILESDLRVPNEVFQPQPSPLMSSARNSPVPKSTIPEGMSRSHSLSDDSKALSSLYGIPGWWPNESIVSKRKQNQFQCNNKSRSDLNLEVYKDGIQCKQGQCDDETSIKDRKDQSDSNTIGNKKLSPMAFTVDFGEADTKKCFGIGDSISRFVPRHRRNPSLTKAEEVMGSKEEEQKSVTATVSKFQRNTNLGTEQSNGSGNKHSSSNNIVSGGSVKYFKDNNLGQKLPKESSSCANVSANTKDYKLTSTKPRAAIIPTSSCRPLQDNSIVVVKDICNNNISEKKGSLSEIAKKPTSDIAMNGTEDASSEAGTYTIKKETAEVKKARNNIDNIFGTVNVKKFHESFENKDISGDAASLAWVREWAESAAQLQQASPNDLIAESETQFFLQETENLVSAMQERVSQRMSNNNSAQNSDSEEDHARSYKQQERATKKQKPYTQNCGDKNSLVKRSSLLCREASVLSDSGYLGYASDSSNEGSRDVKSTGVKYNRAFAIRKGRLIGYDSDGCTTKDRKSLTLPVRGVSPRPQSGNVGGCRQRLPSPSPPLLSRSDGGRFSLRVSHISRTPPNITNMLFPPMTNSKVDSGLGVSANNHLRMTSSVSAIKPDLNMKKQISTPMGLARKPPTSGESRANSTLTSKEVEFANWKRRKSYNPMRAAAQGRKKDGINGQKTEDDNASEGTAQRLNGQQLPPSASMVKSTSFLSGRYLNGNSEDEDLSYVVDELGSSHSNSPNQLIISRSLHEDSLYSGLSHQTVRSKNKLEALDTLVIATIHSLSVKVRTSSRHLLEKLQIEHCNDENGALLEEMVSQLKDMEVVSSTNSSPTKSTSRELSGTLKNLKKLEQVILVLDRVLCDDGDS